MRARSLLALTVAVACAGCKNKPAPATREVSSGSAMPDASPPTTGDRTAIARAFMDHLIAQEFDAATRAFAPALAKEVDAAKLADAWKQSIAPGGAARGVASTSLLALGERDVIIVRVTLERGTIDAKISFKPGSDAVAGFNLDPLVVYHPPAYVDASKYTERDVVIGTGKASLPGTLTTPAGSGRFPAVVLIHGSGPGDRDESIGPSRPFRDLALGLATRGVVVLRYEKRTRGFVGFLGVKPDDFTIKEEYLDDVAAAIAALRATPEVDPGRVFVLGHSMGGMLTPMFLAADPRLAGGIVFSGNARRFEDILVPQYTYLARIDDGAIGPLEQKAIDDVAAEVQRVKDPALGPQVEAKLLPLGIAAGYWLSLRAYDPVTVAKTLPQPLLILQGGRDYQVTLADDLPLWKQGLAGKPNVTFQVYPDTNHAGIPGKGMATPTEYATVEGHVAPQIIDDVAAFVTR